MVLSHLTKNRQNEVKYNQNFLSSACIVCLTLVQVCERLVMQLDSRRGGGAQHILEWGIFGLAFRRKAGVLLLKDWQSQHIAARGRRKRRETQSQHGCDAGKTREKTEHHNERTVVAALKFSINGLIGAFFLLLASQCLAYYIFKKSKL